MHTLRHQRAGFTLLESLITISIVSILASGVMVGLQGTRVSGRIKSAESLLLNARSSAILCHSQGKTMSPPNALTLMCAESALRWSKLPDGWTYESGSTSDPVNRLFSFSATGDGKRITCNQTACTTTNT